MKHLNGDLPVDTLPTLNFDRIDHSIGARSNNIGLLKRYNVNTSNYRLYSFTRLSVLQWNELQRHFSNLNLSELSLSKLKSLVTKYYLNSYIG